MEIETIDTLRAAAAASGCYEGQVGPQWSGPDGIWHDVWLPSDPPAVARVGVMRRGFRDVLWGVAMWREFGRNTPVWRSRPAHMLALVAERHALRRAFPRSLIEAVAVVAPQPALAPIEHLDVQGIRRSKMLRRIQAMLDTAAGLGANVETDLSELERMDNDQLQAFGLDLKATLEELIQESESGDD